MNSDSKQRMDLFIFPDPIHIHTIMDFMNLQSMTSIIHYPSATSNSKSYFSYFSNTIIFKHYLYILKLCKKKTFHSINIFIKIRSNDSWQHAVSGIGLRSIVPADEALNLIHRYQNGCKSTNYP